MKIFTVFFSIFLTTFWFVAKGQQSKEINIDNMKKEGIYLTYDDFVKGKVLQGKYKGIEFILGKMTANYKVNGKTEKYSYKDIWGFSTGERLYRFSEKDHYPVWAFMLGDVVIYIQYQIGFAYNDDTHYTLTLTGPQPYYFSRDLNTPIILCTNSKHGYAKYFLPYQQQYLKDLKKFDQCVATLTRDIVSCAEENGDITIVTGKNGYTSVAGNKVIAH